MEEDTEKESLYTRTKTGTTESGRITKSRASALWNGQKSKKE